MRHRSRAVGRFSAPALIAFGALIAIGVLGAVPGVPAASAGESSAPGTVTVSVTVSGIRSSKGVVHACMTTRPKHFPDCRDDPAAHKATIAAASSLTLTFRDVTPGRYAIALLHDENNNGKADRVLGLMPREGFGFSRDAKVRMGPPEFAEAAFSVTTSDQTQAIRMRYMF